MDLPGRRIEGKMKYLIAWTERNGRAMGSPMCSAFKIVDTFKEAQKVYDDAIGTQISEKLDSDEFDPIPPPLVFFIIGEAREFEDDDYDFIAGEPEPVRERKRYARIQATNKIPE
jgi:hypothetical protein